MRALVLLALVAVAVPSWATNTNKPMSMSQIAARQVEAKYGIADAIWRDVGTGRTVTAGASAGAVVATSVVKGPSPAAGAVIDVAVKRALPWSALARTVAKSLPLISTALAIAEIAETIRCRESLGGGAECDAGQNEIESSGYLYHANSWPTCNNMSSPMALASCVQAIRMQPHYPHIGALWSHTAGPTASTCTTADASNGTCTIQVTAQCTNTGSGYQPSQCGWSFSESEYDTFGWSRTEATTLRCPPVVVNGVTLTPVVGPDGKCPSGVYQPASEDAVAGKAEAWGDKSKAIPIANDLLNAGKPIEHAPPEIDPVPESVIGPRETTQHPDGSTTVRDTKWELAPTPTGYEWTPKVTTKDYPPGATIPPPGEVSDGTTTTGSAPKEDPITCGLPTTPPCKIDESGTPKTGDISKAEVDAAKGSALGKITEIGAIQAPAWTWSFSLPTSCQAMTVGPFLSQTVTVDLCAYQAMIHDLVSLIWASFTVWACVGMVGRTFATG